MKKVKPKKYLGQHFLNDESIALKIVQSFKSPVSSLLEIGPGMGVLTRHLLDTPGFLALDVDQESIDYLSEAYPAHHEKFLLADFLSTDLSQFTAPLGVIGNFPYNISSQIFFRILEARNRVSQVVCMIQKEVADRIVSTEGNKVYGILSVLLQAYFDIEYLFTVKPGVFIPPPKVNSAVIRLTRNATFQLDCDEKLFVKTVKMGFGKRRKTLRNALKDLDLPADLTRDDVFSKRAEQLTVNDFVLLTKQISACRK
ncbi:MAG: 16S rRNA (adenine(1518)-N(6)/adenine(1519)-N(6))-dimethyltransferase RsmA [Cyclobacteriaceae bacterium]|nr:16S rRNA (adenine(1518)-N(6)/adenine(1519)-N(6))-dimethyltransferase RsmA [Cyclobacteriaceae bacterium]